MLAASQEMIAAASKASKAISSAGDAFSHLPVAAAPMRAGELPELVRDAGPNPFFVYKLRDFLTKERIIMEDAEVTRVIFYICFFVVASVLLGSFGCESCVDGEDKAVAECIDMAFECRRGDGISCIMLQERLQNSPTHMTVCPKVLK